MAGLAGGLVSAVLFAYLLPLVSRRYGFTPLQSLILGLSGGTVSPVTPAGLTLLAAVSGLWMGLFPRRPGQGGGRLLSGAALWALALEALAAASLLGRLPFSLTGTLVESAGYALTGLLVGGLWHLQGRVGGSRPTGSRSAPANPPGGAGPERANPAERPPLC